ncbi:MAG: cytochrome b [Brevundimonas sp.]|uniref:cytochrome b n=1 Tax=Brevundimonas sp. TaxID=1871086 RepID=UPI002487D927|nr:cytochrome b [Brevundimonas sp.]MDI1326951.1 cytochrome b [Brevundimonas sp.]
MALSPHLPAPPFSRLSIIMHWLMLALLAAVYACIELREFYPRGSDVREGLKTWHFMLGLSVFVLVWVRLAARALSPRGPAPRTWSGALAMIVHVALYMLMIAMPVLGWLLLSAEGDAVPFFGLVLPPLVAPDAALAERIEDLHTTVGAAGYWLIGFHAAAALFHHYVLRDPTLRRMAPGLP